MTRTSDRKINYFLLLSPSGVVLTTAWLEKQGVSAKLAWWYVQSGLLERLGMKAYKKAGDVILWAGVVSALQNQLQLPLHVGGKTALQLLGRAHFVPMQGVKTVELFSTLNAQIPRWVENKIAQTEFEIHRTSLFSGADAMLGIIESVFNGITIKISSPERAAMELLYLFPKYVSLEEIYLLIENLVQLRPAVVQPLLEKCSSVKVKRLFLFLAEKFEHPWAKNLNFKKIDLGKGKRVIAPGGKYNSTYQISLPELLENNSEF